MSTFRNPLTRIHPDDRWLVIVAHPDDETFGCGSLIAHAARAGAHVTVLCATRGEAGERTPEIAPDADLGAVRLGELYAAADLLGASRVDVLSYTDSGFEGETPAGSLCAATVAAVTADIEAKLREIAPDVIVVLDASDGHRDHEHIRVCTRDAVRRLSNPNAALFETGLPNRLMRRWLDEMRSSNPDAAYHAIDPANFGTPDSHITDVLDHSSVVEVRTAAIALHRSQRSPFDGLSPNLTHAFLAETHLIRVAL